MRKAFLTAAAAAVLFAGLSYAQEPARLVVHVGWDGADYRRVSQMLQVGELPNLAALVQQGSFQRLEIVSITVTRPSWTEQLALPWNVAGVVHNTKFQAIQRGWTIFEVMKAASIRSAFVSGKCPGMLCQKESRSLAGTPFEHVPEATVYFAQNREWSKQEITSRCLAALVAVGSAGYVFCHYQWPDFSGHRQGGNSPAYDDDLRELDIELGVLMATLPAGTVVLLSSDHGFEKAGDPDELQFDPAFGKKKRGGAFGHSHLREPAAILASSLPLLAPATGRDIAKTIYALLGVLHPEPLPEGRSLLP